MRARHVLCSPVYELLEEQLSWISRESGAFRRNENLVARRGRSSSAKEKRKRSSRQPCFTYFSRQAKLRGSGQRLRMVVIIMWRPMLDFSFFPLYRTRIISTFHFHLSLINRLTKCMCVCIWLLPRELTVEAAPIRTYAQCLLRISPEYERVYASLSLALE